MYGYKVCLGSISVNGRIGRRRILRHDDFHANATAAFYVFADVPSRLHLFCCLIHAHKFFFSHLLNKHSLYDIVGECYHVAYGEFETLMWKMRV
jgi:hypothetical protein